MPFYLFRIRYCVPSHLRIITHPLNQSSNITGIYGFPAKGGGSASAQGGFAQSYHDNEDAGGFWDDVARAGRSARFLRVAEARGGLI